MSPYIEAIISQCGGIWGKALGGTDFMRMESVWIELVPLQEEAWERWPLPAMWGYKKTPVYNLERELSPESDHLEPWIMDFQPPELLEINVCYLSSPVHDFWL